MVCQWNYSRTQMPKDGKDHCTTLLGNLHGVESGGGFPGAAQDHKHVAFANGRGNGFTAKVYPVAEMHQPHAKATEYIARSSLGRAKNGIGRLNPTDKILHGVIAEALQQPPVLLQDDVDFFLDGEFFCLYTSIGS